jgi:hypothetical protein
MPKKILMGVGERGDGKDKLKRKIKKLFEWMGKKAVT